MQAGAASECWKSPFPEDTTTARSAATAESMATASAGSEASQYPWSVASSGSAPRLMLIVPMWNSARWEIAKLIPWMMSETNAVSLQVEFTASFEGKP